MNNSVDNAETKIKNSILRLEKWVEEHDYKGYEPFDGLSSYLRPLTFGNQLLERLLLQLVRQSPINLRPLLGVKTQESTKGRGYMAWGYITMFRLTGDQQYKEKAVKCLDWLDRNKSPKYPNHSWGNHFDFSGRKIRLKKLEPIIVWTALIGQAYLDAYEAFGDSRYLDIAISICDWILDLPKEKTNNGTCLSYITAQQVSIHNSNMLGAAMLARTFKITGKDKLLDVARKAMEYSCSRQLPDGAWYYGETDNCQWIDNFHTGYNLDSLKSYIEETGDRTFDENLRRGFTFYKDHFFEDSGTPKYYHNRVYPVDSQCASQAIETLANFSEYDESALPLSIKVANWTINNMQDTEGYFYYRILPYLRVKTPMLHWSQATMYRALTNLFKNLLCFAKCHHMEE